MRSSSRENLQEKSQEKSQEGSLENSEPMFEAIADEELHEYLRCLQQNLNGVIEALDEYIINIKEFYETEEAKQLPTEKLRIKINNSMVFSKIKDGLVEIAKNNLEYYDARDILTIMADEYNDLDGRGPHDKLVSASNYTKGLLRIFSLPGAESNPAKNKIYGLATKIFPRLVEYSHKGGFITQVETVLYNYSENREEINLHREKRLGKN